VTHYPLAAMRVLAHGSPPKARLWRDRLALAPWRERHRIRRSV